MVDSENGHVPDGRVPDRGAAARQAADVAVELSETDRPQDRRRIAEAIGGVARSAARTAVHGTDLARRGGAGIARRGTGMARRDTGERAGRDTGERARRDTGERARRDAGSPRRRTGIARQGAGLARQGAGITRRGTEAALRGAGTAGHAFTSVVNWLAGQVVAMGPRLRVRDQATLRKEFPGASDDEIAGQLIERAARAAAAVGGATGAWAALPSLPAFPAEVAAETLAVVGIEIKLVAELHEAYGVPAPGSATERARAYTASWANRRGVYMVPGGFLLVAGSPLAGQLRRRLAARVRRSAFSLGPLFTGAVAGAMINRRETRKLGQEICADLRRGAVAGARD